MKNAIRIITGLILGYLFFSCSKESSNSEKVDLLTSHIWIADSLLLDGEDAGGPGGMLENFSGDTKFNEDGTGYVGEIEGTWEFFNNETEIVINSDSLAIPVSMNIVELTAESLKLTTSFPMPTLPPTTAAVRLTFKPKE
ncbi:MAG: hypothetical protein U0W24_10025 [Bacteroidales bacterium]